MRSEDEAVHSRDAHMAWITRAVPYICHHRAVLHAHVPRAGRVQCLDLRGEFSGISSTSHSVGLWAQDVRKTYGLQQDDGDSDECGRDEAVHSRGAQWRGPGSLELSHLPYHHAVLHALALRAGSCNVWILAR